MRHLTALCLMLAAVGSGSAWADGQTDCQAGAGTYLTGVITGGPSFAHGHPQRGVELSHTHIKVKVDQDQKTYDVAIDNVFAVGAVANARSSPPSLSVLRQGTHVALCGALYKSGGPGIDWVHTNCGATPTPTHPNGFVRVIGADGQESDNLESNAKFCGLFSN